MGEHVKDQQDKLKEADIVMTDPKRKKRKLYLDFDVSDDEDVDTDDNQVEGDRKLQV